MTEFFVTENFYLNAFIKIVISLIGGGVIVLSYLLSTDKDRKSDNFALTVFLLPVIVSIVIYIVGSDLAKAVSLGGIFALVRFRSIPGDSKEILYVFFSMAVGLANAVSYYAIGLILAVVIGLCIVIISLFKNRSKQKQRYILKITVAENMNFYNAFDEVLVKYCSSFKMDEVKLSNMGTVYVVSYYVLLKDVENSKAFLDEIRIRNGNLNIALHTLEYKNAVL